MPDRPAPPIYDRVFWVTYVANMTCVVVHAATFRFAELVDYLGGTERTAGTIVAVGGVAALLGRFGLGPALDRFGVGRVWRVVAVCYLLGTAGFWLIRDLGPAMIAARMLFAAGLAGGFTGANLFILTRVGEGRGTEAIGTMGTSGFIGLVLGTQVGDRLFLDPASGATYDLIFGVATAAAAFYTAVVFFLTRGLTHVRPAENPPLHRLMARHQPLGPTAVAVVMGGAFCVTQVFLTRFATSVGIGDIGAFFGGYAVSAFVFRMLTRKWSQRIGRHRLLVGGMAAYVIGFGLLPFVTVEWQLVPPAAFVGFGHALLFPSVVSLISEAYPPAYRGSGTNAALGCMEFGTLASAPLLGALIEGLSFGFTAVFVTVGGCAAVVAVAYARSAWGAFDPETRVSIPAKEELRPSPRIPEESLEPCAG